MKTEYEVKVLNINVDNIIERLESLGAIKKGEYFQRRYVYNFNPKIEGKWIRLRSNGEVTTLTIKDSQENSISGTKELEIIVEDFDKMNLILNELGYKNELYQENKRIRYILDDVEFDIDFWPLIPTYLEIEGQNEDVVKKYIKMLELEDYDITSETVLKVFARYGLNLESYDVLKFEEG